MMTQAEILDLLKTWLPREYISSLKPSMLQLVMTGGAVAYLPDETVTSAAGIAWRVESFDGANGQLNLNPISDNRRYVAGDVLTGATSGAVWTVGSVYGFIESGPGYEVFQAYAKMFERASLAGERSLHELYMKDPLSTGSSKATGQVTISRTPHAANDTGIVIYKGTKFATTKDVSRGTWTDKLAVNDYEVTADVVFTAGDAGPHTAQVQSTRWGWQQNTDAGTVTYPHLPMDEIASATIFKFAPAGVGLFAKNDIVAGTLTGARFRVYSFSAITTIMVAVPLDRLEPVVGEHLALVGGASSWHVDAFYAYRDEFNALTVTNAAAISGGTWPGLDAVGDERGTYRQPADPDTEEFTMLALGGIGSFNIGEQVYGWRQRLYVATGAGDYTVGEPIFGTSGLIMRVAYWEPASGILDTSSYSIGTYQLNETLVGGLSGTSRVLLAADPVVNIAWTVKSWNAISRKLVVSAIIPGPRFQAQSVVYGKDSAARWMVDTSDLYTAGVPESDDSYRDRMSRMLDSVSRNGILRSVIAKLIPKGFRYAQMFEADAIGCFTSETDDLSTRVFYVGAGAGAFTVGEPVLGATSGAIWKVVNWATPALTLRPWEQRRLVMGAGAGAYVPGQTVTVVATGAIGTVLAWNGGTKELDLTTINRIPWQVGDVIGGVGPVNYAVATRGPQSTGVPLIDGETITGVLSAASYVIDHRDPEVPSVNDARTAIAWDVLDVDPDADGRRDYGPAYDLTGWVVLSNEEMRGMFCIVLPDIPPPNDTVYPAIYDAVRRLKAAGVTIGAMYRDASYNPITTIPVPIYPPEEVYS